VRAAPKWKMAVDWEGLTVGGGGTATAAIENPLVRAGVARSPAWTSTAASGGFLKRRQRGRGGGSGGGRHIDGGNGEERGGFERGVGQCNGAASAGPAATRAGGAAWHVARPAKQGRGGGADRWAAATLPGGGTG
jgi:hypothetical protein